MSATDELLYALERAGVDRDRIHGPDRFGAYLVRRENPDGALIFCADRARDGRFVWSWGVDESVGPRGSAARLRGLRISTDGAERHSNSMVAKVVEFLSKEES